MKFLDCCGPTFSKELSKENVDRGLDDQKPSISQNTLFSGQLHDCVFNFDNNVMSHCVCCIVIINLQTH